MNDHITIHERSAQYPKLLLEIQRRPEKFFVRGNLKLLESTCLAVVGTRNNTPEGMANTLHFVRGLVAYGITIVSGLAFGIDAAAHETTLEYGGKTIAVLGSGIDSIHPTSHEGLAQEILGNGGLIVSEYEPATIPHKHHFPARNRIISGLSVGTLVVEAPEKSGALITARRAFEQNREVFAVPGDLSRPTMQGCNSLIANDMARLVRTPEDIIAHLREQPELLLQPIEQKRTRPKLATRAQKQVWSVLQRGPLHPDDVLKKAGLSISEVGVALSFLELNGHIKNVGQGRYVRA